MKLWEVKAQALRLMFADSDMNFSQAEFEDNTVFDNANTREKLVRMNDSIARAIDIYYQYNKEQTKMWTDIPLYYTYVITQSDGTTYTLQSGESLARDVYGVHTVVDGSGNVVLEDITVVYTFVNRLDLSTLPNDFSYPTRIDVLEDSGGYMNPLNDISYYYDEVDGNIYFHEMDFASYDSDTVKLAIKFRVFYKVDIINIDTSTTLNDITYDLSTNTSVPNDVQRMIPYFIKGELFQEDEPDLANIAKQEYIAYVAQRPRKTFSKVQTKVRQSYHRTRGE